MRILAGSADGGAALVVNPAAKIEKPADFKGKKIGTPQLGNTQDVACRAWLISNGIQVKIASGDAHVIATPNPEQLPLFKRGNLDAVWTVEPVDNAPRKRSGRKGFPRTEGCGDNRFGDMQQGVEKIPRPCGKIHKGARRTHRLD